MPSSIKNRTFAFALTSALVLLASGEAAANPTGPQVVSGNATFTSTGGRLTVFNTPNTIINWQNFSIGAGEVTDFRQQSATSAVLNRVVGPNISSINGHLVSNGRVFLVNPSGVLMGSGAVIDTKAFVATTHMSDADFLGGRHDWSGQGSFLSIENGQLWGELSITNSAIDVTGALIRDGALTINSPKVTVTDSSIRGDTLAINSPQITATGAEISGRSLTIISPDITATNLLIKGDMLAINSPQITAIGAEIRVNALTINSSRITATGAEITGATLTINSPQFSVTDTLISADALNSAGALTINSPEFTATNAAVRGNTLTINSSPIDAATITWQRFSIAPASAQDVSIGTIVVAQGGGAIPPTVTNTATVQTSSGSISLPGGAVTAAPAPAPATPIVTTTPGPTPAAHVVTSNSPIQTPPPGLVLARAPGATDSVSQAAVGTSRPTLTATKPVPAFNAAAIFGRARATTAATAHMRSGAGVATINLQKREPLF